MPTYPAITDFTGATVTEAQFKAALANLLGAIVQQGTGVGQAANLVKIGFDGTGLRVTVDTTDLGTFAVFDPATHTLTLLAAPTSAMHATTKTYVDTADALAVPKAGGTMTGALVLPGNPTTALQAAPKQYADGVGTAVLALVAQLANNLSDLPNKATARNNLGLTAMATATFFESAETAVPTTNTNTSVAHGLGVIPKSFRVVARCKTAELGYAVGDEITVDGNCNNGSGGANLSSPWASATNVGLVSNSGFSLLPKTGAGLTNLTAANWKLVFRAWA